MKHILRLLTGSAAVLGLAAWLGAVPASAQKSAPPSSGGGGGAKSAPAPSAPSGGSGGGTASAPASGGGSGGYSGGGASKSGGGGGERHGGATGAAGYRAPSAGRAADNAKTGSSGSNAASAPRVERGVRTGEASGKTNNAPGSASGGVPPYSRPRDGNEPVGTAVPRGTTPRPPTGGGGAIWIPGGYYGGYYPGYYTGYYDPWGFYGGIGGYYGGFYDPWYGGYPADAQATYTPSNDEGSLRLKIKPREAEVYVDGYYVGVVDDFDGIFQRLHLDSGSHRIEVRAAGYETLDFDVRIAPDHTTTYQGELKKIQ